METLPDNLIGFKETLGLYRETLKGSQVHSVKLKFIHTFERLIKEVADLIDARAVFSQYGHLRGFCETLVMFECMLDHEDEGSFDYYEAYRRQVRAYMDTLDGRASHAENDRPHQYDWYNAMKRGGFTTSKVSLKTLANDANTPLLNTFHILNVKIHNAEYFTSMLEDDGFEASESARLNASYLMVLNHLLRILALHLHSEKTKPLQDVLVEKRNHMKRMIQNKEKDL